MNQTLVSCGDISNTYNIPCIVCLSIQVSSLSIHSSINIDDKRTERVSGNFLYKVVETDPYQKQATLVSCGGVN